MFRFNLLPPKEKEELELANLNRLLVFFAFRTLFVLLIFTLLLASTYFSLIILLRTQDKLIETRQNNSETQKSLGIGEKIKEANQLINKVYLKQGQLSTWTPLLEEVAKVVPVGVYLANFSYQEDKGIISINGWANTRENLLVFEKSLEESAFFTEIESPLSNLLKQSNIDFRFSFKPIF